MEFFDRSATRRLNSSHRKEQCRNAGSCGSSSLRHTSFLSGLPRFSFSVFKSIAATAEAAKIYVFMAFHPGEPSQQGVPSTSGSVRVACHNLTCGEGIFFWLWNEKSPDTKWYLPPQAPANTSFCTRIFNPKAEHPSFAAPRLSGVKQFIQPHCLWTHEVKKKLPPI